MVSFEFSSPPYAWCKGNYYYLGDTIEEPAGSSVTFYCDIKCTDTGDTEAKGRLDAMYGGVIRCHSDWDWYYYNEIQHNRTCTLKIPSTEVDVSFCARSESYCHDTKCCIKLRPTAAKVDFRIRVLDDATLQPIANAYVNLTIGSDYTDENGYTQWWEVDKGVLITGTITASGYKDKTVSITPLATTTWPQYMEPSSIKPEFEFVNRATQGYLFWNGNKCFADKTKDVPVGQPVSVHAQVKNVGGAAGRAYLQVFKTPLTPVTLCLKHSGSTLIQPGATYTFSEYCFDMDDVNMQIEIDVYALGQANPDTLGCGKIKGGKK